jgi:hypothetical protein
VVTNTNDSGAGSLRQAITDANNMTGTDTIAFNIPSSDPGCNSTTQVCTIALSSNLPQIQTPMTIDGYTQPGALPNTNATGGLNTVLKIDVSGNDVPGLKPFIIIVTSNVTIKGLVINHCDIGFEVSIGISNCHIEGNFIGTNPSGTAAAGSGDGIIIASSGGGPLIIGGATAAARNLISGHFREGINSGGNFNNFNNLTVQGNLIGTDVSGQFALGNRRGISVNAFTPTIFAALNNVISGNSLNGIGIGDNGLGGSANSLSGTIQGNLIGVAVDGVTPLGNGQNGIEVAFSGTQGPTSSLIGGTAPGQGNVIAFNNIEGVKIGGIGTIGHKILGNSIFGNARLGINLVGGTEDGNGVTANDHCDGDTGSNNLQNYPVITSASSGSGQVTLAGTLNSVANSTFRVEFFSSASCDSSGFGEGQTFLGSANVTTDGNCNASFGPLTFSLPNGHTVVAATATLLDASSNPIETSEFSACATISNPPTITGAVSRKTHGAAGNFDVNLPLTGTAGVECRSGGATNDYTMIVSFAGNVTVTGNPQAQVTSGTGVIGNGGVSNGGTVTVSGNTVTIPLTSVTDQQTINVTLNGVNNASSDLPTVNVVIPMSRLLGDTSGNRTVNASDVSQTKGRIGQPVTSANFRSDVNFNGSINSADASQVKANTGHAVP